MLKANQQRRSSVKSNGNRKSLWTLLDANFNRCREGLRVCEDIFRFIHKSPTLSEKARSLRHDITSIVKSFPYSGLLNARDSAGDIGKGFHARERKRKDWQDLFAANIQRVKESLRVLEEVTKLMDQNKSHKIKKIRFKVYDFEKKCARKS